MIQKLIYSLNFARCFNYRKGTTNGYIVPIPEDLYSPVYRVVDVEHATNSVHEKYIEMLARDAAILDPNAVFDLLYGDEISDDEERSLRHTVLAEACNRIKPLSQMGQALVDARRQAIL